MSNRCPKVFLEHMRDQQSSLRTMGLCQIFTQWSNSFCYSTEVFSKNCYLIFLYIKSKVFFRGVSNRCPKVFLEHMRDQQSSLRTMGLCQIFTQWSNSFCYSTEVFSKNCYLIFLYIKSKVFFFGVCQIGVPKSFWNIWETSSQVSEQWDSAKFSLSEVTIFVTPLRFFQKIAT